MKYPYRCAACNDPIYSRQGVDMVNPATGEVYRFHNHCLTVGGESVVDAKLIEMGCAICAFTMDCTNHLNLECPYLQDWLDMDEAERELAIDEARPCSDACVDAPASCKTCIWYVPDSDPGPDASRGALDADYRDRYWTDVGVTDLEDPREDAYIEHNGIY